MRVRVSFVAAIALAVVLILTATGTTAVVAGPDSHMQPLLDGCQRSQSLILAGSTPEWTYVNANDVRQARLTGDQRAGRRTAEGVVAESRPAGEDIYLSHDFHDYNLMVRPDAPYTGLLGSANLVPGEEQNQIEGEWEVQEIPLWAWPKAGDRVRMSGNWIWDCGHWGNSALDPTGLSQLTVYDPVETFQDIVGGGGLRGESTELHPMYEVATFRANTAGILLRYGAHRMSQLDVWINGDGAPAHALEECALLGITNWVTARLACQQGRDVSGTYAYTMKLSKRPSSRSKLVVNPIVVHRETDGALLSLPVKVVRDARRGTVRVSFTIPPGVSQRFGISVSAGWSDDAIPVLHAVRLDRIKIAKSLDGASESNLNPAGAPGEQTPDPGEWVLYANVFGQWIQLPVAQVRDGQTIQLGQTFFFWLPKGVKPTLFVSGHECDEPLMDCIHEGTGSQPDTLAMRELGFNDRPGRIEYRGAGVPLIYGTHTYRPPVNPDPGSGNEDLSDAVCGFGGCYQLTVTWLSKVFG
ncbi:MAG: hypothetical protein WAT66_01140 [Actinomycetota bacterium]